MKTLAALPTIQRPIAEFDRESRDLTERAERWLAAMSGVLAPPSPPPKLPALPEEAPRGPAGAPPVSWQGGVGPLTPGSLGAGDSNAGPELSERLVMKLDAGDLGELSFTIDRSADGMRVIIGADGRNAQAAVGAERETLLAALRAVGLPAQSVTVVAPERVGTVLAQSPKATTGDQPGGADPRDPRARSRRMKFTG